MKRLAECLMWCSVVILRALVGVAGSDELLWEVDLGERGLPLPAVDDLGDVYIGGRGEIRKLASNGEEQWRVMPLGAEALYGSPSLGLEGSVYVNATIASEGALRASSHLIAMGPGGQERWRTNLSRNGTGTVPLETAFAQLAIRSGGNLLIASSPDSSLLEFTPDGKTVWRLPLEGRPGAPAIDGSGTTYVPVFNRLLAVGRDGAVRWSYEGDAPIAYAVPGDSARVWVTETSPGAVVLLSANGQELWRFRTERVLSLPPVVDMQGNLVFAEFASESGALVSLTPDGTLFWREQVSRIWEADGLLVDNTGTVYVTAPLGGGTSLVALDSFFGRRKWSQPVSSGARLSMTGRGVLYVLTRAGQLVAIQTDATGLANSPWPTARGNAANTASVRDQVTAVAGAVPPRPRTLRVTGSPNPFNAATRVRVEVPRPGIVDVSVYSGTGAKVRVLQHGFVADGVRWFTWDGRNAEGRNVATGMYFVSMRTGQQRALLKLLVLR